MKTVRAIVVDDHEIIRYALKQVFERYSDKLPVEIVAEAENGRTAIELVERYRPELVIMDISMPLMNGIEATRRIRMRYPECRIVILTSYIRREYLRELLQLGVSGYVLKTRVFNDLFEAIRAAMNGQVYLSAMVTRQMADDYAALVVRDSRTSSKGLSPRQKEVLQLLAEGKGTKEIAATLGVSAKAIESVRHRIMQKLEMDNLADLTKYALKEGLTTLDF